MQNVRCSPAIAQYETMPREGGMKKMTPFLGKGLWRRGITIEKDCRTIFVWEHAEPWNWSNSAFLPFGVEFHGVPIMHIFITMYTLWIQGSAAWNAIGVQFAGQSIFLRDTWIHRDICIYI